MSSRLQMFTGLLLWSDCGQAVDGIGALAARDLFQLALERPGAREEAAVELVEGTARRKEHEAAGDADGDADRAAVEFDGETLAWHYTSPMRAGALAGAVKPRGDGLRDFQRMRSRVCKTLLIGKAPGMPLPRSRGGPGRQARAVLLPG